MGNIFFRQEGSQRRRYIVGAWGVAGQPSQWGFGVAGQVYTVEGCGCGEGGATPDTVSLSRETPYDTPGTAAYRIVEKFPDAPRRQRPATALIPPTSPTPTDPLPSLGLWVLHSLA